ncbi:putative membrane protein [Enterobacter hormaechei]|nr:putative membrane protein [Enterobacter hormaechei]
MLCEVLNVIFPLKFTVNALFLLMGFTSIFAKKNETNNFDPCH